MAVGEQAVRRRARGGIAWVGVLLGILAAALAGAQDCPSIVAQWGYGRSGTVKIVDGTAYYGMGDDLVVADVHDPSSPQILGRLQLGVQPAGLSDMVASFPYLFAAHAFVGLRVFDVHDPARPAVVASLPFQGFLFCLARAGHLLYLTDSSHTYVVDASDPRRPALAATLDGGGWDIDVAGRYAYVVQPHGAVEGLRVLDLQDPLHPTQVWYQDLPSVYTVRVFGDRLLVGGEGADSFRVFDLADLAHPVLLGACSLPDRVYAIDLDPARNVAVVAARWAGVRVVSLADPPAPVEVASYDPSSSYPFWDVQLVGTVAFVASDYGGLRALDLSDPSHPAELGTYLPPRYAASVAAFGDELLVAESGLRVLELAGSWTFRERGALPMSPIPAEVTVVAGTPVLTDGSTLWTVSLADLSAPTILGSAPFSGTAVAAYGEYAVGGGYRVLEVLDLSDPANPQAAGSTLLLPPDAGEIRANIAGLTVVGSRAYVATWLEDYQGYWVGASLFVVDLTDPHWPVQLGQLVDQWWAFSGVAVQGGYAYVHDAWDGRLLVVDVADPSRPLLLRELEVPFGGPGAILLRDAMLFLVNEETGYGLGALEVFGLSDPADPVLIGTYLTGGDGGDVEVVGRTLYVADGQAGVEALSLDACWGAIFRDGFESGDARAWSLVYPPRLMLPIVAAVD